MLEESPRSDRSGPPERACRYVEKGTWDPSSSAPPALTLPRLLDLLRRDDDDDDSSCSAPLLRWDPPATDRDDRDRLRGAVCRWLLEPEPLGVAAATDLLPPSSGTMARLLTIAVIYLLCDKAAEGIGRLAPGFR